jgi:hypothetical protein
MLQRTVIKCVEEHDLELPDFQCLANTIDSVRSAGALLDSITISLLALRAPGTLVLAPDIRQRFSSGMRQLKNFEFTYNRCLYDQDVGHLTDFLSACLDTSSLTCLMLDLGDSWHQPARINVGNIIGSQSRHELTDIFLAGTSIELSVLVLLLQRLPDSMSSLKVRLSDLYLLSGTWKEALDALRKKESHTIILDRPCGAEFNDMSRADYSRIFFDKDGATHNTIASRYIANRFSAINPIQALKDGLDLNDWPKVGDGPAAPEP